MSLSGFSTASPAIHGHLTIDHIRDVAALAEELHHLLCDAPSVYGGAWNSQDQIVFGSSTGTFQVSALGGSPSPLTSGSSVAPSFLPDGRHFVYWGPTGIWLGSEDGKHRDQAVKKVLPDETIVAFAPSSDPTIGYLLFVRGAAAYGSAGTLMAQSFDTQRLELTGEAVPIADQVHNEGFSASAKVLVYATGAMPVATAIIPGVIQGQLTWFDRGGKALGTLGDPGSYRTLALSPDGKRVAFDRDDPQNPVTSSLWLYEFARGITTRFTFSSGRDGFPVWSPDGSRIAYTSNRAGKFDLYQKASNLAGEDELLFSSDQAAVLPLSWSGDGHSLIIGDVDRLLGVCKFERRTTRNQRTRSFGRWASPLRRKNRGSWWHRAC